MRILLHGNNIVALREFASTIALPPLLYPVPANFTRIDATGEVQARSRSHINVLDAYVAEFAHDVNYITNIPIIL